MLAFSVIYDWRLNQTALPLSARLALALNPGTTPATETPPRKQMSCPLPEVPVITPAPVEVKNESLFVSFRLLQSYAGMAPRSMCLRASALGNAELLAYVLPHAD